MLRLNGLTSKIQKCRKSTSRMLICLLSWEIRKQQFKNSQWCYLISCKQPAPTAQLLSVSGSEFFFLQQPRSRRRQDGGGWVGQRFAVHFKCGISEFLSQGHLGGKWLTELSGWSPVGRAVIPPQRRVMTPGALGLFVRSQLGSEANVEANACSGSKIPSSPRCCAWQRRVNNVITGNPTLIGYASLILRLMSFSSNLTLSSLKKRRDVCLSARRIRDMFVDLLRLFIREYSHICPAAGVPDRWLCPRIKSGHTREKLLTWPQ